MLVFLPTINTGEIAKKKRAGREVIKKGLTDVSPLFYSNKP
jgi:hypothetical protein